MCQSLILESNSSSTAIVKARNGAPQRLLRCLVAMVEDTPCIQVVRVSADGNQQTADVLNLDLNEGSTA